MTADFAQLEEAIGYHFKQLELLDRAMTHRSLSVNNNERLEFLGDAILGMIIAQELFLRFPEAREGALSRIRSTLVNGTSLAGLAQALTLSEYLRLGQGEKKSGGHYRLSILADAFEALVGAIFLDSDFATCRACVVRWYGDRLNSLVAAEPEKDAKSRLQEWAQARKYTLPRYEVKTTGRAHAQTFHVVCRIVELDYVAEGESSSRRKAEQLAAQHYLDQLDE